MTASGAGDARPLVRMVNITRRWGDCVANDRVSLDIWPGTIHGLIGENGAGKSTLMKLLYGMDRPTSGMILVDSQPVSFAGPRDALALGIGMVHQHFMLIPTLSVLDNIILGSEPGRGGLLDRRAARARLLEKAGEAAAGLDLARRVEDLSVGEQQRVEILKLLYRDVRLLILDEPTAVLSPREIRTLLGDLIALARRGRTIVFISHHLAEVLEVTDRVSVLRQGRLVATHRTKDLTAARLAEEIVGEGGAAALVAPIPSAEAAAAAPVAAAGAPVLELADVVTAGSAGRGGLNGLSLVVRAGEIVAVAGVEGNGQSDLARVAAGRLAPRVGRVTREGVPVPAGRCAPAGAARTGYIPEDRQRDALVASMSAAENCLLGRQHEARFRRGVAINEAALRAHTARLMTAQDVRPPDPATPAGAFSGGNQQKLVVAREMEENPRLVVAAHPTRGLDLKAAGHVHAELRARRDAGAAVLLITADLDEARALGDRMVVLFAGRVAGEVPPRKVSDEELGLLMTGAGPRA